MSAPIQYTLDKHNRIIALSKSWHEFYVQNGGARPSGSFIGENLLENIAGREVRMLYGTLLRHVRSTQVALSFPYCCNSDKVRRDLVMTILPQPDESLTFSNTVQSITPWSKTTELAKLKLPPMLTLCSWCNRIKADTWMEPQTAIQKFGLFDLFDTVKFTHGICPRCQTQILSTLSGPNTDKSLPNDGKNRL